MLRSYKIEYSYQENNMSLNDKIQLLLPDDLDEIIVRISKSISIFIEIPEKLQNKPINAIAKHAIKQYHSKVLNQDITKLKIKSVN